jgi:hypothetical protein
VDPSVLLYVGMATGLHRGTVLAVTHGIEDRRWVELSG